MPVVQENVPSKLCALRWETRMDNTLAIYEDHEVRLRAIEPKTDSAA